MREFLHAELEDTAWDALVKEQKGDPRDIREAIRAHLANATEQTEDPCTEADARLLDLSGQIASEGKRFLQSLPTQTSIFRGGEDGARVYRSLHPLFSAIEAIQGALYDLILRAAILRQKWEETLLAQIRAEAFAFRLQLIDRGEETVAFLRAMRERREQTETILAAFSKRVERIRELEETVVSRFLSTARRAADAEHDGIGCDRTRVVTLVHQLIEAADRISK